MLDQEEFIGISLFLLFSSGLFVIWEHLMLGLAFFFFKYTHQIKNVKAQINILNNINLKKKRDSSAQVFFPSEFPLAINL